MRVEIAQATFFLAKWNLVLATAKAENPEVTEGIALVEQALADLNVLYECMDRMGKKVDALEGENASLQADLIAQGGEDGNEVET